MRKGSYEHETARLQKELSNHVSEWFEKTVSKFLETKEGLEFVKKYEGKSAEEAAKILIEGSNLGQLLNEQIKKKISQLRGAVN